MADREQLVARWNEAANNVPALGEDVDEDLARAIGYLFDAGHELAALVAALSPEGGEPGLLVAGDEPFAAWQARGWREERCRTCGGCGVVSDYSGEDFNGAMECPRCDGGGQIWRTPNGKHYAVYPGGPFCG